MLALKIIDDASVRYYTCFSMTIHPSRAWCLVILPFYLESFCTVFGLPLDEK